MTAKTLADVINAPKTAEINLDKCFIVKTNDNGTYNVSCEINNKREYVNYVDISLCKDNKLYVNFGKKEANWKKDRWYQVEAKKETEEETEEETKEDK